MTAVVGEYNEVIIGWPKMIGYKKLNEQKLIARHVDLSN